ncbi:uncharacterized protein LOC108909443 [Anoplophora glabripennis]|uniref:uncharacterized protein LOC108909443 n=1 Tax=Anoplophora glabripennis TaxID=217634 RepID=UPI000873D908|nr:uncharacterized protein LOC108909443 [Anoplophora glabripennis]
MEQAVEDLENKMKETDQKMGNLALQVGNIESEIFSDTGEQIEVNNLLKSVSEVKTNYQNLRKDLMEVQDLQKQLSSTLHMQLKLMQAKFNMLKEKLPEAPISQSKPSNRVRQCGQEK